MWMHAVCEVIFESNWVHFDQRPGCGQPFTAHQSQTPHRPPFHLRGERLPPGGRLCHGPRARARALTIVVESFYWLLS